MACVASALSRRRSGNTPPWTMPNCAWPALLTMTSGRAEVRSVSSRLRHRAAQRTDRCIDSAASSRVAGYARHSSRTIATSDPEPRLDIDGALGRQTMGGAVDVGLELRAVFGDPPPFGEAEHLIAAAVGQDGTVPPDESMEASEPSYELVAGAQVEVVGVAEDDLGARFLDVLEERSLHRALRPHRHERGRMDDTVRRLELAEPGTSVGTRARRNETESGLKPFIMVRKHETARRCDLRRSIGRARGLGRLGGVYFQAHRSHPLSAGADPHRQGRPLGAGREGADGDLRR